MKRTPLKPVGKIGRANKRADRKIAQIAMDHEIYYCEACEVLAELGHLGWQCLQSHSNTHRHERDDYKHDLDKLWDFKQWIYACIPAHQFLDRNKEIREQVFIKLRGEDNLHS